MVFKVCQSQGTTTDPPRMADRDPHYDGCLRSLFME